MQVGGAELNTAVALARLGRSAAWVSRLTTNPLGRLIANHAREAGVSTEFVQWTGGDRVGVLALHRFTNLANGLETLVGGRRE